MPSFFNKADFYSVLLPGYLVIITYLTLFHYDYLFGKAALSFELLSALVFLVAGPVTGLTIRGIIRIAGNLRYESVGLLHPRLRAERTREYVQFTIWYVSARLSLSDAERAELDNKEAESEFSLSGGISLVTLALAHIYSLRSVGLISLVPLVAGLILLTSYFPLREDWGYLIRTPTRNILRSPMMAANESK